MTRKTFEKETGVRKPMTRTHEAYSHYYEKYAEWLEQQLQEARENQRGLLIAFVEHLDLGEGQFTPSWMVDNFLNKQDKEEKNG